MTKKDNTPTIILELTPREAAAIHSLVWSACWNKGDYGSECREIGEALKDVLPEFKHLCPILVDYRGIMDGGSFWLIEEENDNENLHSYSGA